MQESEFKLLTKGYPHLTGDEQNHLPAGLGSKNQSDLKTEDLLQYSRRQPPWHVFVLSVFTLSIYNIYWFYKCLNQLNELAATNGQSAGETNQTTGDTSPSAGDTSLDSRESGKDSGATLAIQASEQDSPSHFCQGHPIFSTMLFLIPVINLIIGMQFFSLIGELLPDKGSYWHKNHMLCGFALALAFGALFLLSILPAPYFLLYLLTGLPLALAQAGLNRHWTAVEPDKLVMRAAFNPIELVVIFFGAGFLGLCAVGAAILPKAGN